MQDRDRQDTLIRARQALALNRQTGFTFLGHFLRLPPDLSGNMMKTEIDPLPLGTDEAGEIDIVSFGIFLDIALSRSIRISTGHYNRMSTSNLNVTLRGARRNGRLTAKANFMGFIAGSEAKQACSQVEITGPDGAIGAATGMFVFDLSQPPITPRRFPDDLPPLDLAELDEGELWLYRHAETSLDRAAADGRAFFSHFWGIDTEQTRQGATATILNDRQLANRGGHLQGGVQLGIVCRTANTAAGEEWMMTGVNATYMRPGTTKLMKAVSEIVYRGRLTAFIVTRILDADDRLILQASSTHAKRGIAQAHGT